MYAELRIELDPSVQISYQQSSNLQGVIMEQIDTEYAQKLHESKLNPYSQYLLKENGKINWYNTVFAAFLGMLFCIFKKKYFPSHLL